MFGNRYDIRISHHDLKGSLKICFGYATISFVRKMTFQNAYGIARLCCAVMRCKRITPQWPFAFQNNNSSLAVMSNVLSKSGQVPSFGVIQCVIDHRDNSHSTGNDMFIKCVVLTSIAMLGKYIYIYIYIFSKYKHCMSLLWIYVNLHIDVWHTYSVLRHTLELSRVMC